jgi:plastocyanin
MPMVLHRILWGLLFFILHVSAQALADGPYREMTIVHGGTISGTVRLAGEIPQRAQLATMKDDKICGVSKPSLRLRLGRNRGVADAVISLEGITAGKPIPSRITPLVLNQAKCEYEPHITLLQIGSPLTIVNRDPILHNVHVYDGINSGTTLFNIAQPVKGQRSTIKSAQFKRPGYYLATCDAGHPWMSAYVVVTEHPYYAVTDANGNFTLDNVPPGTYKIRMWHEGVFVDGTGTGKGQSKVYTFEEPYEVVGEVTVPERGVARSDFQLVLRTRQQLGLISQ